MSGWRGAMIAGLTLYLSAAAQQALALRYTFLGGHLDWVLASMAVLCLFTSRSGGALVGFSAGLIYGAVDGANLWQYIVTRTLVGFVTSWLAETGVEKNLLMVAVTGAAVTVISQVGLMFLAPPPQVMAFLGDTIRTAVYNGVLALLLYAGLRRILGPRR